MLYLMRKEIDHDNSRVIYDEVITEETLKRDWNIYNGDWWVEKGWLTGRNPNNCPSMVVSKGDFPGNVMVEFEAKTVLPSTHDINFMWSGSWDKEKNERDVAYVIGVQGWWEGKVGFEKSPDYKLNVATKLFNFEPGKTYHIMGGSIDGHCFVFIDGKLALEVTDPDPIDTEKCAKVGFEAYCSHIQIKNIKIRQIKWNARELSYTPEF